jgi:hypothetical protein
MADTIVVPGEGTLYPHDRPYWTTPEMLIDGTRPLYSTAEVAKSFMGRSPVWMRMRLWRGFGLQDQNGEVELHVRSSGHRRWSLYDVERSARSFLEQRALTVPDFAKTINVIKAVAHLYGFDLGDYDPMSTTVPFDLTPQRKKALQAVLERMEQEDLGQLPTSAREAANEHLIARTVWSMRDLEDYYRGADT